MGKNKRKEARHVEELPRAPGRVRSAWRVLMGQSVTPQQIMAEWLEYQTIFSDLLNRQSALLARHAKAEKARISNLQAEDPRPSRIPEVSGKADLRRRAAALIHKDRPALQAALQARPIGFAHGQPGQPGQPGQGGQGGPSDGAKRMMLDVGRKNPRPAPTPEPIDDEPPEE